MNEAMEKEKIDISLDAYTPSYGTLHPLTLMSEAIEDCFIGLGYQVAEGPEVELDYYNFEKKNIIKAMQLYKLIIKEDSNLGGNVRAKQKLDKLCESVAKVLRKWLKEDETFNQDKNKDKLELDSKNTFLPSDYKKNSLEDIMKAKEQLDNKANIVNDKKVSNPLPLNVKKPVFEQIYTNKQKTNDKKN
ncbi:hypothetical protein [Brachyspira innocens]|uniref:tRNA ligase subunit PheS family protein n=1 Tax=Brachyspira innocens TaxID=13264 RepID=UPI0034E96383